jgi:hypothetical protein
MSALTTFAISVAEKIRVEQSSASRADFRSGVQGNVQSIAQSTNQTHQAPPNTEVAKITEHSTKQPTQSWWETPVNTAPMVWGIEGQIVGRET